MKNINLILKMFVCLTFGFVCQSLAAELSINPTGGLLASGGDGLKIVAVDNGQLQVRYVFNGSAASFHQFYEPSTIVKSPNLFNGVYLAVGALVTGSANGSDGTTRNAIWGISGQTSGGLGTAASPFFVATTMFSNTDGVASYSPATDALVVIETSYIVPDTFFTQKVTVTPPAGNMQVLKFAQAIDSFLSGGDNGPAFSLPTNLAATNNTTGNPSVVGVRKDPGGPNDSFMAFAEVQGGREFDHYYSAFYAGAGMYGSGIRAGGNIVHTWDTNPANDHGMGVQFDLGAISTPTTFSYLIVFGGRASIDLDGDNSSGATGSAYNTSYSLGGPAVEVVDTDVSIRNVVGDIVSATITLANPQPGDTLSVVLASLPVGITVTSQTANQIVVGSASPLVEATFESALRNAIRFSSSGSSIVGRTVNVAITNELGQIGAASAGAIVVTLPVDTDTDGVADPADLDDDNDGILDSVEGAVDTDTDGKIDALDLDSDNDGILDINESGRTSGADANADGRLDSPVGTDGVPDSVQVAPNGGLVNYSIVDTDGDMKSDFRDLDSDNDGLYDVQEANGTDLTGDAKADGAVNANGVVASVTAIGLTPPDTDGDSRPDFRDLDADNDGINDVREANGTDTDGDGLADGVNGSNGLNASVPAAGLNPPDTDGDLRRDWRDLDSDNDGINDVIENGGVDSDNNGIVGAGPVPVDMDADGIADIADLSTLFGDGMDPLFANGDNDLVPNFRDLDSDNDSIADVIESGNGAFDTNGDGFVSTTESPDTDVDGIVNSLDNNVAIFGDSGNAAIPEQGGLDVDTIADYLDLDSDQNGLTDMVEAARNVAVLDPSGDGQIDAPVDPDGDGIANNGGNDSLPAAFGGSSVPDTDGDLISNLVDLDDDNDGILDSSEGIVDTDGDGVLDRFDLDTDNDGILDITESGRTSGVDANADGRLDGAVGSDGVPDSVQATVPVSGVVNYTLVDTDGDSKSDFRDLDSDNDGINDVREANGTDVNGDALADGTVNAVGVRSSVASGGLVPPNTDGDSRPDFRDLDSDNDGINDVVENGGIAFDPDNNGIAGSLQIPTDTDGDGIADSADLNVAFGDTTDPVLANADNDLVPNFRDLDSDNDTLADVIEGGNAALDINGDGTVSSAESPDGDGDGIANSLDNNVATFGDAGNAALPEQGGSDVDTIPDYLDLDSDQDGLTDLVEAGRDPSILDANGDGQVDSPTDPDGDGIPNNNGNDTLAAVFGGSQVAIPVVDTDTDGLPDSVDLDDDNDGILDSVEGSTTDTDGDLVVDRIDLDSDNDGLLDVTESGRTSGLDANNDGRVDGVVGSDGVPDSVQATVPVSGVVNYSVVDTDGDLKPDFRDLDSDNDGLSDVREVNGLDANGDGKVDGAVNVNGVNASAVSMTSVGLATVDTDADLKPDFRDLDSDNDGINDVREANGTDVNGDAMADGAVNANGVPASVPVAGLVNVDTDGDLKPDFRDLDSDNDGINDVVENASVAVDTDNNGLVGTGLIPVDTDGDGIADVADLNVTFGDTTDPVLANGDNDPVPNFRDLDSDNDTIADVIESGNGAFDINNDGTVSSVESPDGDNDGIPNSLDNAVGIYGDAGNAALPEQGGFDVDLVPDYLDLDSNQNGITDLVEAGKNPAILDPNGDGQIDSPADADGDGIPNNNGNDSLPAAFGGASPPDVDSDGISNAADLDDDNDGILDSVEGTVDTDGDAVIDAFDLDSDNDGILDIAESGRTSGVDANADGRLDGAVGSDGVPDSVQATVPVSGVVNYTVIDTDGDSKSDFRDLDSDNDGINDVREANGTDVNGDALADGTVNSVGIRSSAPAGGLVPPNTDGDSKPDFRDLDSDNDGLNDVVENGGVAFDTDNNGLVGTGAVPMDTDGDGIANVADLNVAFGDTTDPVLANGDNDSVPNFRDLDSDNDSIADVIEGGNAAADINGDGFVSPTESPDADGDGIPLSLDNAAMAFGDAGNAAIPEQGGLDVDAIPDFLDLDSDQDALTDLFEAGRDPAILDASGDGQIDSPADPDGDGIPNNSSNDTLPAAFGGTVVPDTTDTDGDGIFNGSDLDDDNDGITDALEGQTTDTDGDGIVDRLDLDSDNDGILDVNESGRTSGADVNNDGRLDGPSGADGIPDSVQAIADGGMSTGVNYTVIDTDGDLKPDFRDLDSDNDGLSDVKEVNGTDVNGDGKADGTNNANGVNSSAVSMTRVGLATIDTDGDSKPDFRDLDSDNDGINDVREANATDTNADGIADGAIIANGVPASVPVTGLINVDTDGDLKPDFRDLDSDNDGLNDVVENGGVAFDTDNNGIIGVGLVPVDADGDGIADVADLNVAFGDTTDPTLANGDNDSVPNFRDLDSDNDTVADVIEGGNAAADVNGNGFVSLTESPDADGDGIVDSLDSVDAVFGDTGNAAVPEQGGFDVDTLPDFLDLDSDQDALTDLFEAARDPSINDVNGDGQVDSPADPDGDGVPNNNGNDSLPAAFGGSIIPDTTDTDGDGIFNGSDLDDDNDGITDAVEGQTTDTDGDGIVDRLDLDSDNDGILDVTESGRTSGLDANNDGRLDGPVGADGIPDSVQATVPVSGVVNYTVVDTDGDLKPDFRDLDSDNDGLSDVKEVNGTDVNGDGKADGAVNVNGINLSAVSMTRVGLVTIDTDGDSKPDFRDLDSDNDGINDVREANGTDVDGNGLADGTPDVNGVPASVPTAGLIAVDTDGDGKQDFRDLDSDNDGINDVLENGGIDSDNNGMVGSGQIPTDTDGDGIGDVADSSVSFGDSMDPVLANGDNDPVPNFRDLDSDNDTVADVFESGNGAADTNRDGTVSSMESPDTDNDGIPTALDNNPMIFGDAGNAMLPEQGGTDTDMIPDYLDLDSDQDGLTDLFEAGRDPAVIDANGNGQVDMPVDTDNDGIPNNGGNDRNPMTFGGSTVPDTTDTDGDGIFNGSDLDDDNDGILDSVEGQTTDTDGDLVFDRIDLDADNDGILDVQESGRTGGVDANGDGRLDGMTGTDGIPDSVQAMPNSGTVNYTVIDTDGDMKADWRDLDSDNDGLNDVRESNGTDVSGDGKADGAVNANGIPASVPSMAVAPVDTDGDLNPDFRDLDSDNDGINDVVESGLPDSDNNGIVGSGTNPMDADGDGIADIADSAPMAFGDSSDVNVLNADNDTVPNYRDLDSDNDSIADIIEAGSGALDLDNDGTVSVTEGMGDSDKDGIPNVLDNAPMAFGDTGNAALPEQGGADVDMVPDYLDLDSDGDGIPDLLEATGSVALDVNSDGQIDMPVDADKDGVPDNQNNDSKPTVFGGTTAPLVLVDTDKDGIPDALELIIGTDPNDADSDDDGVIDGAEPKFNIDSDNDGLINALDPDSDNDGLFDGTEMGIVTPNMATDLANKNFVADADSMSTTNPLDSDTDKGGVKDGNEDINHNGRVDAGEMNPNVMADDMAPVDSDSDGLSDAVEAVLGTNPSDADSDDDGVLDGAEPNLANDTDLDGKINALDADSDADGLFDGTELGIETPNAATDVSKGNFIGDADPMTKTNPLLKDSDKGTVLDGTEDTNHNGKVDASERDPLNKLDDVADKDSDSDGILDWVEGAVDTDGDGKPNYLDTDSDGDGILDSVEAGDTNLNTPPVDTDADGKPDYLDLDSDNDGLTDALEGNIDTDGDGKGNFKDTDSDNDGIKDGPDNCYLAANGDQTDLDQDGQGNACDIDMNGDGLVDDVGISGGSGPGCSIAPSSSLLMLLAAISMMRRRKI